MSKATVNIKKEDSVLKIDILGSIDEDVEFSSTSFSGATQIILNLAEVKSINSCGIREWIKWLSSAGGAKIEYHNCPKIIVDQINMVDGFLPASGQVISFFVPYYNEDSGEEKLILFKSGSEFTDTGLMTLEKVLDSAGNEMEMDVIEAKYFKFLKK
jgi:hypothetical protein